MKDLIYLEYKESTGAFHYNQIVGGRPQTPLNTNGWGVVAKTPMSKASIFCSAIYCDAHKMERAGQKPISLQEIMRKWRLYCFIFNSVLSGIDSQYSRETFSTMKDECEKRFSTSAFLSKLGNEHFVDLLDSDDILDIDNAWQYNPTSYFDSNY